jgi:hypothetical protein
MAAGPSALACPLCKDAVAQTGGLASGFFWSILLMLAVPFVVVGVIGGLIVKSQRGASQREGRAET